MEKKFILTEETRVVKGKNLYRIRAAKDFGNVKRGDLGGFVEKEENLSHEGNSWICDDARVFSNAYVSGNAYIYGNARISGNARICGNARVCDGAYIYGNARICDNAYVHERAWIYGNTWVYGNAHVYGDTRIYGNARIYDNVCIYDNAYVYGDTRIGGNAHVFEDADVFGNAVVHGDARICEQAKVQFSRLETDLRKDLKASLRCQCNLIPEDGKVIAYKLVYKNLRSLYDKNFVYKIGGFAVCINPKEDNSSCSPGLHFSNLTYWDNKCEKSFNDLVYLKAEIDLQDIITIQEGKIRCRKAKILSKIEIK